MKQFLAAAHENHGHLAAELSLDFLIGRAYWPTRVSDLKRWCGSCHACQLKSKRPIKSGVQPIQVFEPMAMIGMDWLGPISPACSKTGHQYILILIDYFSRFMWAKLYETHMADDVLDMFENHLTPIFGHPAAAYSDNGSQFVNEKVSRYFEERGVTHCTGPISHPSSTGLMERGVQGMISFLRAKTIEHGAAGVWSNLVKDGAFFTNTNFQRIQGFSPSELMLGFEPQQMHYDLRAVDQVLHTETLDQEVPRHIRQIFTALRDERRCLASDAVAYVHYQKSRNARKQKIPKEGDLVVVRNHAVHSQKGRKLESRWLGPRILVLYTASGLSAYVRELHGSGKAKRYHLNGPLLYNPRSAFKINDTTILQTSHGTVPAVIGGRGGGEPGSRAVFLSSR